MSATGLSSDRRRTWSASAWASSRDGELPLSLSGGGEVQQEVRGQGGGWQECGGRELPKHPSHKVGHHGAIGSHTQGVPCVLRLMSVLPHLAPPMEN